METASAIARVNAMSRTIRQNLILGRARFLDEDGGWTEEWDSSTLAQSSRLPVAAEVAVAFVPFDVDAEPEQWRRRIPLALRPIELEQALTTADEDGGGDDDECVTVGECIALNPDAFDAMLAASQDPDAARQVAD